MGQGDQRSGSDLWWQVSSPPFRPQPASASSSEAWQYSEGLPSSPVLAVKPGEHQCLVATEMAAIIQV